MNPGLIHWWELPGNLKGWYNFIGVQVSILKMMVLGLGTPLNGDIAISFGTESPHLFTGKQSLRLVAVNLPLKMLYRCSCRWGASLIQLGIQETRSKNRAVVMLVTLSPETNPYGNQFWTQAEQHSAAIEQPP